MLELDVFELVSQKLQMLWNKNSLGGDGSGPLGRIHCAGGRAKRMVSAQMLGEGYDKKRLRYIRFNALVGGMPMQAKDGRLLWKT